MCTMDGGGELLKCGSIHEVVKFVSRAVYFIILYFIEIHLLLILIIMRMINIKHLGVSIL